MSDTHDRAPTDPTGQQWLHDLRNAMNALGLSLEVVQRCIEQENPQRALEFLARAREAAERCRKLLRGSGAAAPE